MIQKNGQKQIIFGICLMVGFLVWGGLLGSIKSAAAIDGIINGKIGTGEQDDYVFWLQTYDKATPPYYFDRFYVGKNGNIGIGTTTPNYLVDINGAINATSVLVNGVPVGSGGGQWVSGGGGVIYYTGGSVGIGGTNPGAKLDIFGSLKNSSAVKFNMFNGGGDVLLMADNDGNITSTSTAGFGGSGVNFWGGAKNANIWNGDAGVGNVGVGTTNPSNKLDVEIQTTTNVNGTVVNSYPIVDFTNLASGGGSRGLQIGAPTGSIVSPVYLKVNGTSARFSILNQNDVENFTILEGGNVGIGLTNPGSRLVVKGTATSSVTSALEVIASDNTSRLIVKNDGNVGIVQPNPQFNLDVIGSSNFSGTANAMGLCINNDCRVSWDDVVAAGGGNLWNGTTTGAIWNDNGANNVGIGTSNPGSKLSIAGASAKPATSYWHQDIKDTTAMAAGVGGGLLFTGNKTAAGATGLFAGIAGYKANATEANESGQLRLYYSNAGTLTAGITLNESGNVGIGTTNPVAPLHLQKTAVSSNRELLFKGTVSDGGDDAFYIANGTSADGRFIPVFAGISNSTNINSGLGFNGYVTAANDASDSAATGIISFSALRTSSATDPLNGTISLVQNRKLFTFGSHDGIANIVYMTIASGGNVGIGLTNPVHKLSVAGTSYLNGQISTSLSGTGSRCVYVDASGNLLAKTSDCGTATGGDNMGDHTATTNIKLGNYWLSGDGGAEGVFVKADGNVGVGTSNPGNPLDVRIPFAKTDTTMRGVFSLLSNESSIYPAGLDIYLTGHATTQTTRAVSFQTSEHNVVNSGYLLFQPNGGNVGISLTNPGVTLDVNSSFRAGSATVSSLNPGGIVMANSAGLLYSLGTSSAAVLNLPYLPLIGGAMTGSINMGANQITNVYRLYINDKLTVSTIDPLYKINGINYSTFVSSIVGGTKEEYTGKITIDKYVNEEYEAVINFAKLEEGNDLWVWRKVVDFSKENVEVAVTPYGGFAQVYYLIEGNNLIFRADKPIEISYRLIGKRYDWKKWPTKAIDQTETPSAVINSY